ncbi:VanZ family protein [Massilia sp. TS11]|uniref:VanZ family protein n=1 Tax=Massilia sp. TS11 TaxID=2908003 RepID=UPI001ED9EA6C|nr:VanZ family protein [Massilia sp. TS11]MCG2585732.1 VanZ family protein [Massilia sp. TS11]
MLTLLLSQRWPRQRLALALCLYALAVIIGSVPGARAEMAHYASGVVLHGVSYAGLAWLWFTGSRGTPRQRALQAVAAVALMGAGDEWVQSFFPYRHASVLDWLVDLSAASLAALGLLLAGARRPLQADLS